MKLEKIIAVRNNKTVYRNGDKCIKVFNEGFSKADILNEALNQARIEETGLNVPKLLGVNMIGDKWAIVSEFIRGKTLARQMEEHPEKEDEYLALFVDLQLEMHSKTCVFLTKMKDKISRGINKSGLDAAALNDLHTELDSTSDHNEVCHGDFNPSNIIITPDGIPYILDWSHVSEGNAAADVARTYLLFRLNGDIVIAEKYLDIFCSKSSVSKQYVRKWMPVVAAAQLPEGNEREREFLLSWTNSAYCK